MLTTMNVKITKQDLTKIKKDYKNYKKRVLENKYDYISSKKMILVDIFIKSTKISRYTEKRYH
jgi:hypothetical protein